MAVKYAEEHVLITVGGSAYTERWQFGTRWRGAPGFDTTVQLQNTAENVATSLSGSVFDGGAGMSVGWDIDVVKAAAIGTNGKYLPGTEAGIVDDGPIVVGSRNAGRPAPQLATVATLETGTKRGLAHYGRCYLPPLEFFVDADGRISQARAQAIADGFRDWLQGLDLAQGNPGTILETLMVYSALKTTDVRAPVGRAVTGISVGRVIDTHRSRRESLEEDRQTAALE